MFSVWNLLDLFEASYFIILINYVPSYFTVNLLYELIKLLSKFTNFFHFIKTIFVFQMSSNQFFKCNVKKEVLTTCFFWNTNLFQHAILTNTIIEKPLWKRQNNKFGNTQIWRMPCLTIEFVDKCMLINICLSNYAIAVCYDLEKSSHSRKKLNMCNTWNNHLNM